MNPDIKTICVGCHSHIEYSEFRYERQGNFCDKCSARCGHESRHNIKIKKNRDFYANSLEGDLFRYH